MLKTIDIPKRRLPELVAEQITEFIRSTPLQPGDRLPAEAELARQFGVGRTSVREGLQKLQTLGLINVVRGRGVYVSESHPDDGQQFIRWSTEHLFAIEEMLEARITLEVAAAALASGRATPEEIARIESANLDHLAAAKAGNLQEIVSTDQRFHEALMEACHNQLLLKLYGALIAELTDFRRNTLSRPGVPIRSAGQHSAIIEAIRARDHRAARHATIEHLWVLHKEIDAAGRRDHQDTSAEQISTREALE